MKKIESIFKYVLLFIIAISVSSFSLQEVSADMGPKPLLNLYVKGLDVDYYYLDLLIDRSNDAAYITYHLGITNYLTDEQSLEVEALFNYEDPDDYYLGLLEGTRTPMWGSVIGELQDDGSYFHRFRYVGVPEDFKIIILTSEGDILVSDVVHRGFFQSEMIYDLSDFSVLEQEIESNDSNYYDFFYTNITVVEEIPFRDTLSCFFLRMIITVMAELGIAYYIFKFKAKKSLIVITVLNIVTQLFLNLIMFSHWNQLQIVLLFIILEIFVFLIEYISYYLLFDEGTKKSILKYVLVANLVTLSLGLVVVI